jgi:RNA polymerase sigma-70 factor (ECF subfamily)
MSNPVSDGSDSRPIGSMSSGSRANVRLRLIGQEGSNFAGEPERPTVSDWANALSWGRDEAELVSELQAGSETAFDWLVTHYHGPVYNLILSMLGDTSDAADGTQEVFLKAFRGIRSFRQGSSLKTWLYRIALREALNHKRWFKRHLQKNVSIDAEPEDGHCAIEIEDLGATPFEQFAAHEIQAAVQDALQHIPEVFRGAVILRDLEGLSYEEVAEVLDCSVGTVKSRILRGRRALKDLLEPLLVDRSAIAHENDRSAIAWEENHLAQHDAASHSGASMMPRPAFAPSFGPHASTVSARSKFSRGSSASEDLP